MKKHLLSMDSSTSGLFGNVYNLIKLLILCPASSAEPERSFSALRRLKTWLRSTVKQNKLDYEAVCHVHKYELDKLDLNCIIEEFVSKMNTESTCLECIRFFIAVAGWYVIQIS